MTHSSSLLVHPDPASIEYQRITPQRAGWDLLHFGARRMSAGQTWSHDTGGSEFALVILGGVCSVESNRGHWTNIGRRPDVFSGMPYALYLPRGTQFTLLAHSSNFDAAYGWCAADQDYPAALVTPADTTVEIRGGGNATRQINGMLNPGFNCQRLIVVEVYTPAGSWSSYPPHKHDEHRAAADGRLLEADLEEVYFYKFAREDGARPDDAAFAIQRVYTTDGRLEETLTARGDDVVLVPEGYHPVAAAHGYHAYYLNILAGSAQSLANSDDPEHAWVKQHWQMRDPRLPLVTPDMENQT